MTLGQIIKDFRNEHGLTLKDFSKRSGITVAYLSMLENNKNSKNGKPIIPTYQTCCKVADGIGVSIDWIIDRVDDFPVRVTPRPAFKNEAEALKVADAFDQADEITKELVRRILFN